MQTASYYPVQGQESGVMEFGYSNTPPKYTEMEGEDASINSRDSPRFPGPTSSLDYQYQRASSYVHSLPRDSGSSRRHSRERGLQPLQKPVVIPQMTTARGQPFSRAYSPLLQSYGITAVEFMEFIDNLNIEKGKGFNNPLQGLDMPIVSGLVNRATNMATRAGILDGFSENLDQFLYHANHDIFFPRQLQVKICTTSELHSVLDLPRGISVGSPNELSKLSNFISPLTFDVPSPTRQTFSFQNIMPQQHVTSSYCHDHRPSRCEQRRSDREYRRFSRKQDRELHKLERNLDRANRKSERDISKAFNRGDSRNTQVVNALQEQEREMYRIQQDMAMLRLQTRSRGDNCSPSCHGYTSTPLLWLVVVNI
ncbi:hypothetical protein AWJ20_942 [Sugiyamaella lignohabitans]|uniref:Uncharacterized protein n=1 Tax=Sugiyamaella lignohabitans TaxID=796027 RepID=A0A161HL40_9ASCO|nr:uncharacterized protein AWJ20_942 [Sugiyamaella lignohabitans]ANB12678.1 hypothetical protein AWJ20_942 [Sugiyamaella lignohabitans]